MTSAKLEHLKLTRETLEQLLGDDSEQCISILMETHESGRSTNQNAIRFKNLIRAAGDKISEGNPSLGSLLDSVSGLSDDDKFWQHRSDGVAIFLSPKRQSYLDLEFAPPETVSVSDRFLIRQIAPHACGAKKVAFLAVTWEQARLFVASDGSLTEVDNDSFPADFNDLVAARDPEENLQLTSHRDGGQRGGDVAMFHGHGEGEHGVEADRLSYLASVAERAGQFLYEASNPPLVLIATQEVAGHFQAQAKAPEVKQHIAASPDGLTSKELHARMEEVTQSFSDQFDQQLVERLGTAVANGNGTQELSQAVLAAVDGRVDTLIVDPNCEVTGTFDSEQRAVQSNADGKTDLVNLAVQKTLECGGTVVSHKGGTDDPDFELAAIFRY